MIKALFLRDFRNYKEEAITFSPHINYIYGDNAQGKTNLLEAIHLLIAGRSFRSPHLTDMIRFGASMFYLEAHFEKNGIEQTLKFCFEGEGRKIYHNATALPTVSSMLGILNGVILSPEDHTLLKGGPQARRQFLDLLIAQSNPLYLHHLSRYYRAMKQRNALLKQKQLKNIEIWEEQMIPSATYLAKCRLQTTQELEKWVQSETLASDKISLSYRASSLSFEKHRRREQELGTTLSGPHRDDLLILIHNKEARMFGSEGQQRSCVAALKLAQWKYLHALIDHPPLMCIDDVGVSLDKKREKELYHRLEGLGQVFLTSPHRKEKPCENAQLIHIRDGSLSLEK